jgi:hypothetical protein
LVYTGSTDDYVYALKVKTGEKIWSYQTGGEVESFPSIANGVVYVGSGDSNVYAFGSTTDPQPSPPLPSPTVPEITTTTIIIAITTATTLLLIKRIRNTTN